MTQTNQNTRYFFWSACFKTIIGFQHVNFCLDCNGFPSRINLKQMVMDSCPNAEKETIVILSLTELSKEDFDVFNSTNSKMTYN